MSTMPQADVPSETRARPPLPRWLCRIVEAAPPAARPLVHEAVVLLGFAHFLQLAQSPREPAPRVSFSTLPEPWGARYVDLGLWRDDPCLAHARGDALPALLFPDPAPHARGASYHDAMRSAGLAAFVCVSFHGCAGDLVVSEFGLAEAELARISTAWLASSCAEALLLAHVVHHRPWSARAASEATATEREIDCLALASLGHKCEVIADRLQISVHTVRFHLRNVRARFNSRTLPCALACAMQDPRLAARIARQRLTLAAASASHPVLHEVTGLRDALD